MPMKVKTVAELIDEAREEQAGAAALLCREASPMSKTRYIPCDAPASRFVLSEHGTKVYPMCPECASHNLHNRDAVDVGAVS